MRNAFWPLAAMAATAACSFPPPAASGPSPSEARPVVGTERPVAPSTPSASDAPADARTAPLREWLVEAPAVDRWSHGHDLVAVSWQGRPAVYVASWEGQDAILVVRDGALQEVWRDPEERASHGVAAGDLDGDGVDDVAVAVKAGVSGAWLLGGEAPLWRAFEPDDVAAKSATVGDLDGDGRADIVLGVQGANRAYRNAGAGFELLQLFDEQDESDSVALADADGDGDLDLLVGNSDRFGQADRYYANQGGRLRLAWASPVAERTNQVRWCDLDGDGRPEMVVAGSDHPNRVYGRQDDGWTLRWRSETEDSEVGVACADGDRDGDVDLLFLSPSGARLIRNVDGRLEQAGRFIEDGTPEALIWTDLDGDARPDLAIAQQGEPWVRWWRHTGRSGTTDAAP